AASEPIRRAGLLDPGAASSRARRSTDAAGSRARARSARPVERRPASELSRRAGGVTVMADKKADFSDVQSGSSSTAPSPPAPKPTPDRTYTVVAGDSLSKIAKKLLGNANRWHEIHELNKDTIKNPDLIRPGQVLKIPAT